MNGLTVDQVRCCFRRLPAEVCDLISLWFFRDSRTALPSFKLMAAFPAFRKALAQRIGDDGPWWANGTIVCSNVGIYWLLLLNCCSCVPWCNVIISTKHEGKSHTHAGKRSTRSHGQSNCDNRSNPDDIFQSKNIGFSVFYHLLLLMILISKDF